MIGKRLPLALLVYCPLLCVSLGRAQDLVAGGVPINEVAQFVSGISPGQGSPLVRLERHSFVRKYQSDCRELSEKWEATRLSKIRKWAKEEIHPKINRPASVKYMFGGPDFVHVVTMFPGVKEYVLCGLEPLGTVPDLFQKEPAELDAYLSQLNFTLRSISMRSFFITKEMRQDFGKQGIDGVFPVLLYFAAMTGHEVLDGKYINLTPEGEVIETVPDKALGLAIQLRAQNRAADDPFAQTLYFFKTDLSNAGFQAGNPFTRFLEKRADGVGYAKAASFLMHTPDFSNIRNFLVGNCQYFLQDASGIRADFLAQYFNVSYYGNYAGPIDMFSEYDQPDLRAIYQTGVAKPLPFGTGYRYLDKDSVQMFGVRK